MQDRRLRHRLRQVALNDEFVILLNFFLMLNIKDTKFPEFLLVMIKDNLKKFKCHLHLELFGD